MAVMAVKAVKAGELAVKAVKAAVTAVMAVMAVMAASRPDGRGRRASERRRKGSERHQGHTFQPDLTTMPSDRHSMTPSSATAPLGPEVPQYVMPLTVR